MVHPKVVLWTAAVIAVVAPFSAGAIPAPLNAIDALQPGEWYEVPNSNLSAVAPNPAPTGSTGRLSSVIDAWSGGAYDTKRDRLLVWGGGHADYAGNEIYAFDVNALAWSRPWGPSMNPPPEPWCGDPYPDGNPASRHSYDGMQYVPSTDRFWAQGGSVWKCGNGTDATWTFDFVGLSWSRKANASESFLGVTSAYDPVTGHVFHQSRTKFSEYDPVNDTWSPRGTVSAGLNETGRTGALDPVNRLFVSIGSGELFVWDLDTWQFSRPATTGGAAVLGPQAPGFVYDSVGKQFVAWAGGTSVYTLDVSTWTWSIHGPAASNTVTPTAPKSQGTYGRFRYIPSKNAFVVVNGVYENVFVYKLSAGGGTPPPATPPPPTSPPPPGPAPSPSPPASSGGSGNANGSHRCGCSTIVGEAGAKAALGIGAGVALLLLVVGRRKPGVNAMGLLLAVGLAVGAAPAMSQERKIALSDAEFEKLHQEIRPPKDELWRTIPWKISFLDGREAATREKKPIFVWVASGEPLGCG